jgi:hypothetical protein
MPSAETGGDAGREQRRWPGAVTLTLARNGYGTGRMGKRCRGVCVVGKLQGGLGIQGMAWCG